MSNKPIEQSPLSKAAQKQKNKPPKRNKSAFILFSQDRREELKKNSDLNSNLMMVELGNLWKELSHERKEHYEDLARQDKDRYQRELQAYSELNPEKVVHNKTKNNHVKKPCSAYAVFLRENLDSVREEHPNKKMADILKIVSPMWKALTQKEKKPYQEKAKREQLAAKEKINSQSAQKPEKSKDAKKSKDSEPSLQKKQRKEKKPKIKQQEISEVSTATNETSPKDVEVVDVFLATSIIPDVDGIPQFDLMENYLISPTRSSDNSCQVFADFESFGASPFPHVNPDPLDIQEEEFAFAEALLPDETAAAEPKLFDLMNFATFERKASMNLNIFGKPSEELINYDPYEKSRNRLKSRSNMLNQIVAESLVEGVEALPLTDFPKGLSFLTTLSDNWLKS